MVEIPLTWRFQILGANDVKTRLEEVNSAFQRGELSASDYAKELRRVNTDARAFVNVGNVQKNLLLAQHPTFNLLSRSASTLSSVSRGLLAITNALNLARIAGTGLTSQELEVQKELNEVLRAINRETDPIKLSQLNEEAAILKKRLEELNETKTSQGFSDFITTIGSIGTFISTSISAITNNPNLIKAVFGAASRAGSLFGLVFTGFSALMIKVGTWLSGALAVPALSKSVFFSGTRLGSLWGAAFIGGVLAALAAAGFFAAQFLQPKINELFRSEEFKQKPIEEQIVGSKQVKDILVTSDVIERLKSTFQPLLDLFTKGLPEAYGETEQTIQTSLQSTLPELIATQTPVIKDGFVKLWNTIIEVMNSATESIIIQTNQIFRALISHLNSLIRAYNRAARKIGKPTVPLVTFTPAVFTPVPLIKAQAGFSGLISQPTNLLVGEGGPEFVNVIPRGKPNQGNTIIVHLHMPHGTIIAENELYRKFDQRFKDALKRRGFTGV